jgi:hypothetical protein
MADKLLPPKRPHSYHGETVSFKTGCGTVFVTVSTDETGYPVEVFGRGKGGCMSISLEALGKATAVALRCGVDAQEYIDQFKHMICPSVGWDNGKRVSSCAAAIGMALDEVLTKYNDRLKTSVAAGVNLKEVLKPVTNNQVEDLNNVLDEDGPHIIGVESEDRAANAADDGTGDSIDDEARAAKSLMKEQMAEREKLGLR